jgi:hypothetical protein
MPVTTSSDGPDELSSLRQQVARLDTLARRRGRLLAVGGGTLLALGLATASGVVDFRQQLASCRAKLVESRQSLSALARRDAGAPAHLATAPGGAPSHAHTMQFRRQQRRVIVLPSGAGIRA